MPKAPKRKKRTPAVQPAIIINVSQERELEQIQADLGLLIDRAYTIGHDARELSNRMGKLLPPPPDSDIPF